MKENQSYFGSVYTALRSIMTGLKTSMRVFVRKKETEQYPENRDTLVLSERFRGELHMPHNEQNEHKCVGCGLCESACPNGTIAVYTEMQVGEDGKRKKVLTQYEYNLSSCMFCNLCVTACPHDAICFVPSYEQAVFDINKLYLTLNQPGSRLMEKAKPVRAVAEKTVEAVASTPIPEADTPKEDIL